MNHLINWLTMGGYSTYIWSAYSIVAAALLTIMCGVKWQRRRTRKMLKQWFNS